MQRFLDNVKVVELVTAATGPSCGKLLAELGAQVILVEAKTGVINRKTPQFDFTYTGARSIAIDLKTDAGRGVLGKILEDTDVFLTNFRVKALQHLGFTYENLKERYPKLIYALITGYGEAGPMKDDQGYDNTCFWGRAGLLHDMIEKGGDGMPPVQPSGVGDIDMGLIMTMGILAALYNRSRTGEGMKVSSSLLNLGLYLNFSQIILSQYGVEYPKSRLRPNRALSNSYPAKDGYFYLITINFRKDFPKILRIIEREDLMGDPRWNSIKDTEGEGAQALRLILDEGFRRFTIAELRERFAREDLAFGLLQGARDVLQDPQVAANEYLRTICNRDLDGRTITVPVTPVRFNDEKPEELKPAAGLGEHTREILQEYAFSEDEIETLYRDGVVVTA